MHQITSNATREYTAVKAAVAEAGYEVV